MQQVAINQFSLVAPAPSGAGGPQDVSVTGAGDGAGFAGLLAGLALDAEQTHVRPGEGASLTNIADEGGAQVAVASPSPSEGELQVSIADGHAVKALPDEIDGLLQGSDPIRASGLAALAMPQAAGPQGSVAQTSPTGDGQSAGSGAGLPRSVGAAIRAFLAGASAPDGVHVTVQAKSGEQVTKSVVSMPSPDAASFAKSIAGTPRDTGSPTAAPKADIPPAGIQADAQTVAVSGVTITQSGTGEAAASPAAPAVTPSAEIPGRSDNPGGVLQPVAPAASGDAPSKPEAGMPQAPAGAAVIAGQAVASNGGRGPAAFRPTAERGSENAPASDRATATLGGVAQGAGEASTGVVSNTANGQAQLAQSGQAPADSEMLAALRRDGLADGARDSKFTPAGQTESGGASQQGAPHMQSQPPAPTQTQPISAVTPAPAPASSEASASQSAAGGPAQQPATPPTPAANMVGLSIARAVADGQSRFTVRLDPPELGRVDIRLEMSGDGAVRAVIRADSQDTLDLLQRDVRQLERALADGGLKTDSGSLNFYLNQQGQGGRFDGSGQSPGQASAEAGDGHGADAAEDAEPEVDGKDASASVRLSGLETDSVDITI